MALIAPNRSQVYQIFIYTYTIYTLPVPFLQQHTVSPVKKISITGNKNLKVDQQEKSLSYIRTQASKPTSYLEQRSNVPQFAYSHLSLLDSYAHNATNETQQAAAEDRP